MYEAVAAVEGRGVRETRYARPCRPVNPFEIIWDVNAKSAEHLVQCNVLVPRTGNVLTSPPLKMETGTDNKYVLNR